MEEKDLEMNDNKNDAVEEIADATETAVDGETDNIEGLDIEKTEEASDVTNPIEVEDEEEEIPLRDQILNIIASELPDDEVKELLDQYHENDIAEALDELDSDERRRVCRIIGLEKVSEVLPYVDDASEYIEAMPLEYAADVLENMDSDDAVDVLEDIESEEKVEALLAHMDPEASEDVRLINSYEDDEIGSMMTTNYVAIKSSCNIKGAMKSMVSQCKDNDNISTIYVIDEDDKYYGAIDLRDLIIARATADINDIISKNYPSVRHKDNITDVIESLKDYSEDSIPVLDDDDYILGIITSQDIVEAVDDEMGDDYAKLAGLTSEEDLHEKLLDSMKKRIPWLILLLFLGLGVSTIVGLFEGVVTEIAVVVCFQSMILGMAGNVGTQSLAVTIRVLMDENVSGKEKGKFILKETRTGAANGALLGMVAILVVGSYLHFLRGYGWQPSFEVSGCVGLSLLLAMIMSSCVGAVIPMFFHKIKVDPAVASGPLISTVNDLIAVITYYGLCSLLLVGNI